MKASDDLRHEHEAILFSLKILEGICSRLNSAQVVSVEDISSIIEFLKTFADRCHHGKEEGFLFPALENAGVSKENGPIGVMLMEHEKGRALIREMALSIDESGLRSKKFVKSATDYVTLLRAHIEKENNVLFPMGDNKLSEEEQENLLENFDDFEQTVIGGGKHDEYHNMLTVLKKRYLFI